MKYEVTIAGSAGPATITIEARSIAHARTIVRQDMRDHGPIGSIVAIRPVGYKPRDPD